MVKFLINPDPSGFCISPVAQSTDADTGGGDHEGGTDSTTYGGSWKSSPADESLQFDANGNRTTNGAVTGLGNRVLFGGQYYYSYDRVGNRTSRY